jgi:hypothetical protein
MKVVHLLGERRRRRLESELPVLGPSFSRKGAAGKYGDRAQNRCDSGTQSVRAW